MADAGVIHSLSRCSFDCPKHDLRRLTGKKVHYFQGLFTLRAALKNELKKITQAGGDARDLQELANSHANRANKQPRGKRYKAVTCMGLWVNTITLRRMRGCSEPWADSPLGSSSDARRKTTPR